MDWDAVFEWIGKLATIALALAVGLAGIARAYIDKWLDSRFQAKLAALNHSQALEIARFQLAIDTKLNRASKLHDREFEVLPRAWDLLCEAGGAVTLLLDENQTHPDLSKLDDLELNELLSSMPFSEAECDAIRSTPKDAQTQLYAKRKRRYQVVRAGGLAQDFHNYVASYGVFVEPSLRSKLLRFSDILSEVVQTHSQLMPVDDPNAIKVRTLNRQKFEATTALVDEIGDAVSARLWGASDTE